MPLKNPANMEPATYSQFIYFIKKLGINKVNANFSKVDKANTGVLTVTYSFKGKFIAVKREYSPTNCKYFIIKNWKEIIHEGDNTNG